MRVVRYDEAAVPRDEYGRAVPAPGAYEGMPEKDYRAAAALSQSDFKAFAENPRKFLKSRSPGGVRRMMAVLSSRKDTEALRVGRYLHTALLEPQKWRGYGRYPAGWTLSEKHAKYKAWRDRYPGKEPVRASEFDPVEAMRGALESYEPLRDVLTSSSKELSIFWRDEASGLDMKARLDLYNHARGVILDPKTTGASSPKEFERDARRLGYHVQVAQYGRAVRSAGETPMDFLFVVVLKEEFEPGVFLARCSVADIEAGCAFLDEQAAKLAASGLAVPKLPSGVYEMNLVEE